MGGYQRVYVDVWDQPWSHDTRYLAFYLMTCEHRITEGLFRLPKQYMSADLDRTPDAIEDAIGDLIRDGFVEYDDNAKVVLLPGALRLQQPANKNHVKPAVGKLARLPKTYLFQRFYALARQYAPAFADGLLAAYPERILNAIGDGTPNPPPPPPPPPLITPESPTAQSTHTPDSGVGISDLKGVA